MSKIRTLFGVLALLVVLADAAGTITPKTPVMLEGCYFISSKEDLYGFAAIVNGYGDDTPNQTACARLGKNIVVNENVLTADGSLNVADTSKFIPWIPIWNFRGTFNGQGFTISGLYVNDTRGNNVGLFGTIVSSENDTEVSVKNLGVYNSYFRGSSSVGAVVGDVRANSDAPIVFYNIRNHSRIEAKSSIAGGIAGLAYGNIQFKNCANSGSVSASYVVGGIVGLTTGISITITNALNVGVVETPTAGFGDDSFAGGIVGQASGTLKIMNVFNQGYVVGYSTKGGIFGSLSGTSLLVNAYNAGPIYSYADYTEYSGPILGRYVGSVKNFEYANVYYQTLDDDVDGDEYGVEVSEKMMKDGTVAYLLHDYHYDGLDASIWGQNVGVDSAPDFSGSITGDMPLVFESLSLNTYEDDVSELPKNYVPGYKYDLPLVTRENYEFWGWYDNADFDGTPVKFIPATANGPQEFWARYSPIYKITYHTGVGITFFDEEILSYVEGKGTVLPRQVTQSGAVFRGWYKDDSFDGERLYEIGPEESGNVVLYAKWLKKNEPSKDADGCYVIKDASDLYGFAAIVNGTDGFTQNLSPCAYLDNDIVLNKNVIKSDGSLNDADTIGFMHWVPINGFEGVFDGRGHSISGLYVKCDSVRNYILADRGYGFFGSLGVGTSENPVVVKNVGIEASYISAKDDYEKVGALVGIANGGDLSEDSYIEISNCYSTSTVSAASYPGGIVGVIDQYSNAVIENCYNSGLVEGRHNDAGGLIGSVKYAADVKLSNSYNVGEVMSYGLRKDENSLIGYDQWWAVVTNCYYLKNSDKEPRYGVSTLAEQFEDGTVAYALHNGENGSIWGQNVGVDLLPNFSGKVKNSAAKQYKVTFHTYEGDEATYFNTYVAGLAKDLPVPAEREGYSFSGWFTSDEFLGKPVTRISSTAEGDLDFYAKWIPDEESSSSSEEVSSSSVVSSSSSSAKSSSSSQVMSSSSSSVKSSSSEARSSSSSSVKSSSSESTSSSSSVVISSSSTEPKSSSSAGKTSSSSRQFELLCNGKSCIEAVMDTWDAPQLQMIVSGRNVLVTGVQSGSTYAVLDVQGHVLSSGRIKGSELSVNVSHSGNFLVRIDRQIWQISVR